MICECSPDGRLAKPLVLIVKTQHREQPTHIQAKSNLDIYWHYENTISFSSRIDKTIVNSEILFALNWSFAHPYSIFTIFFCSLFFTLLSATSFYVVWSHFDLIWRFIFTIRLHWMDSIWYSRIILSPHQCYVFKNVICCLFLCTHYLANIPFPSFSLLISIQTHL